MKYGLWYNIRLALMMWTLGLLLSFFMGILLLTGRLRIRGRENLSKTSRKNRLIISNHPSFLDPLILPFAAFLPIALFCPWRHFPWQTPNQQFIKDSHMPFLKWAHTILIETKQAGQVKDPTAVDRIAQVLRNNTIIMFPEGTRSSRVKTIYRQTQSGIPIGEPKLGAGRLAYHEQATIIPILIKGADRVMPPTSYFPNFFRGKIEIIIGKQASYEKFLTKEPVEETYAKAACAFMDAIASLDI